MMDQDYLSDNVRLFRTALAGLRPGHRNRPIVRANLASALQALFQIVGEIHLLDEAEEVAREVLADSAHGTKARLDAAAGLSTVLASRLANTLDPEILRERVELCREIASATGTARDLGNLALALSQFASATSDASSATEAVTTARQAVDAAARMPFALPGTYSILSDVLAISARLSGASDQGEAIQEGMKALAHGLTEPKAAALRLRLAELLLFSKRHDASESSSNERFLADAHQLAQAAFDASDAPADLRIEAARLLVRISLATPGPHKAHDPLDAATSAVEDLLPQLAHRSLAQRDRDRVLARHTGLGAEAALAAIHTGRPDRAVRLLEASRGFRLAELLETRGPLERLRERSPDLAAEFLELRRRYSALEAAAASLSR
ncbi:hypothetical protein [Streptomyces sp. NPDC059176]|uniref:hypothetical protein n=1 Tax=Streptomyces sp. NPDC059176 TaxID=3346758 RepID=UPI0036AD5F9F